MTTQIIDTIYKQLTTPMEKKLKVWSWGAHGYCAVLPSHGHAVKGETLQFRVSGPYFTGHVRIEYDYSQDSYNIHFGRYGVKYPDRWLNIRSIEDVFCYQLTNLIDEMVNTKERLIASV